MRGQRTDLEYDQILKYIEQNQPVGTMQLHIYLRVMHNITRGTSRSRILARLQKLGLITRMGYKRGNTAKFVLTSSIFRNKSNE